VSRGVDRGREAWVGSGEGSLSPIPCEALGAPRVKVAEDRGETVVAMVPEGAVGFHERPNQVPAVVAGPAEVVLNTGEVVSFKMDSFLVTVAACSPEKASWAGRGRSRGGVLTGVWAAVAAGAHAGALFVSAQSANAASFEPEADVEAMTKLLATAESRSAANEAVIASHEGTARAKWVDGKDGSGAASGGAQAKGREGTMGSPSQRGSLGGRYSVKGEGKKEAISRADAVADARAFGLAGVLSSEGSRAPFASFGEVAAARGVDALGTHGDMWASSMGETFGAGGLGLSGVGEGGGGEFLGIGLGRSGFGHGAGSGDFTGGRGSGLQARSAWGAGWGGSYCASSYAAPCRPRRPAHVKVRVGGAQGRALREGSAPLDLGAIGARVQRASGALMKCYSSLVSWDEALDELTGPSGTVVTDLVIDEDGRVVTAGNASSTFGAPQIALCVTGALRGLAFPARPGFGAVGVHVPVGFQWQPSSFW